ncbi:MAG: tetratricopeptide repeat protein [Ginsengibacter sp.]
MNLKAHVFIGASLLASCLVYCQSVESKGESKLADSVKVNSLLALSKDNLGNDPVKAIEFGKKAVDLSNKIGFKKGTALGLKWIGIANYYQGNNFEALNFYKQSLTVFTSIGDDNGVSNLQNNIGAIYMNQGDDARALDYFLQSLQLAEKTGDKLRILTAMTNVGAVYSHNDSTFSKAIYYDQKALPLAEQLNDKNAIGTISLNLGNIYTFTNKDSLAMIYYKKSLKAFGNSENSPGSYNALGALYLKQNNYHLSLFNHRQAYTIAKKLNGKLDIAQALQGFGRTYAKMKDYRSAIGYFLEAESIAKEIDAKQDLMNGYLDMSTVYDSIGDYKKALFSHVKYSNYKDTLVNDSTYRKLSTFQYDFDLQKKEGEITLLKKDNNLRELEVKRQRFTKNAIFIALIVLFIFALIIYRYYRIKAKTNHILDKQNHEINESYKELKSTQAQLIQSEKMASLGELTAGIAHEIQNPLNFVNNFSELNKELLLEMKDEIDKGNINEIKSIANDLIDNQEKINYHGKRADAIVKGMMQHSRANAGQKEPTDINALADEYFRLSYHGLRAKDKSFNAILQTDFDRDLSSAGGKINVVPQDIGRVLLNLYNNAFYAVNEKKKTPYPLKGTEEYEPTVSVSTKKIGDKVEIKVADNGNGIPQKVLDKIYQPFFTTKPAGQGTGLGLSLTYDVIKAHGGKIRVETKEGEGAEFIIELVNNENLHL